VRNLIALKGEVACTAHDFELIFNVVITAWTHDHLEELVRHLDGLFGDSFFARLKFKALRPRGRALANTYIIPRYSELSPDLVRALEYATRRRIECFVETTPLCYLPGFEHCSLETDNIVRKYVYGGWNFHSGLHTGLVENDGYNQSYVKPAGCKGCGVNLVCAGVWRQYLDVYGDAEFQGVDRDPTAIARRVLKEEPAPAA